ncbi:NAD(P)-dependent oxidoreductase [Leucobacter sp. M11]|uniref:NAD(P)-dependent oxidoreductase n=1 Tax=Leucobacter sp. M11 TaxID=2993565 RepID=UPI002D804379|nr:NAD(P)H-binding protein [Leucobacter sp. M11]MEB4615955.1 NAD(P)H-binding protein [Leucobacter sp. M11]
MTRITVFGGGGFAGSHITESATVRGHDVTVVTRSEVPAQIAQASYRLGDLTVPEDRARAIAESDVIVLATAPRGDMVERFQPAIAALAEELRGTGVRLGVVGGAGSLQQTPGGPLVQEDPNFPAEFLPDASALLATIRDLEASPEDLDWFVLAPAGDFGGHTPGSHRGEYRVGGRVLLTDEQGVSYISGADYGEAFLDEIETPAHRRELFTVAY